MTASLAALGLGLVAVATAFAYTGRHRLRVLWAGGLRWLRLRGGRVRPRYPVVLLHGAFGFEELSLRGRRVAYFRGVAERLASHGITVKRARVSGVAGIAVRAAELAERLRALPPGKVNLVAHSMGGLDARYAIARLGIADRVASLVTVGTPHRGTPLADVGRVAVDVMRLGWISPSSVALLRDLGSERMLAFNNEVPDMPGVYYASVVARAGVRVHPLLRPSHALLALRGGDNDGIVPSESQAWGEVLFPVEADHWEQIGWSGEGDAGPLYEAIVRELRARGL